MQASTPSSSGASARHADLRVLEHRLHAAGRERCIGCFGQQQRSTRAAAGRSLARRPEDLARVRRIAAREHDVAAQVRDVHRDLAVLCQRLGFVEQPGGSCAAARDPGVGGRLEQAAAAYVPRGRQPGRVLGRQRCGGVGPAFPSSPGGLGERGGGRGVGPECGGAEMPCALVRRALVP